MMPQRRSVACIVLAVSASCWRSAAAFASANASAPVGWPGATEAMSNAAWNNSEHKQPEKFASWPMGNAFGACPSSAKVLRDYKAGWPGQCLGLDVENQTVAQCATSCLQTSTCSVWQYVNLPGAEGGCFQGSDTTHCRQRDDGNLVPLLGAQRIQHGDVTVLKIMTSWWVKDLRNLGVWSVGNASQDAEYCRANCYSDIHCQYWQYGKDGCWLESKSNPAAAPLTIAGACGPDACTEATSIIQAEYILHSCPTSGFVEEDDTTGTLNPPHAIFNIMAGAVGLVALALAVVLVVFCLCCKPGERKPRGVKKTRTIKVAAKQETAAPAVADMQLPLTYAPAAYQPAVYQQVPQQWGQ